MAALDAIPDPEIPAVSIIELGMIGAIDIEPERIRVELLPTFVGCPALDVIRDAISTEIGRFGLEVDVEVSFATPWTSDRISPVGREKLRQSGFAPPPHLGSGRALPMIDGGGLSAAAAVPCPYCGSVRTTLENLFGPTQCRSIRHCADCRQPFEAFKAI
jgi:ring-1,2-phenylacetyl-CoA epoxidase subunit PaaD